MANVDNILGQADVINHLNGTIFDHTFNTFTKDTNTNVETVFPLTDYTGVFTISKTRGSTALYTASSGSANLIFSATSVRVKDNIDLTEFDKLYYDLVITHTTDTEKVYRMWFGVFYNLE